MPFNLLTDSLPDNFEGFLINYSFRAGILISECLSDESFESEFDRIIVASRLLFGKGLPDLETSVRGLNWFLNGGSECKNSGDGNVLFSFVEDSNMIFSAFMLKYGINLNKSKMHFFEFLALFNDLDKSAFKRVVDLRAMSYEDVKKYSKEDRYKIMKLKDYFALKRNEKEPKKTKFDKLLESFNHDE